MRTHNLVVAAVFFVCVGARAESFDTPKVSWSGTKVHVEAKTDMPDGASAKITISGRTDADKAIRGQFVGRVKGGYLVGSGSVSPTEDEINIEPGHYMLAIWTDGGGLYTFEFGPH